MERLSALSRGAQLMLVGGLLLLIDTFLPWQKVGGEIGDIAEAFGADTTLNAWHGFWGVMLGILTIVLLVWLVARLAGQNVQLPVSEAMIAAGLALLIFLFALIKVLVDNEFRTIWAWIGLILAAVVAVGAWLLVKDAGGVATLRTEASGMTGQRPGGTASAPPPPDAHDPARPSAPSPPPSPPTPSAPPAPPAAPSQPAQPMPPPKPAAPEQPPEEDRPA
jgi:hypothetical protein